MPDTGNQAFEARFWNRQASSYAAGPIKDMAGYERSLKRTRDFLTPEDRMLEIGCGTGSTALKHAPYVRHITGTDISPEMIAIAEKRLADCEITNADFVTASTDDARFASGWYDVVMAHSILHLLRDLDATLALINSALKPGGHLISKTPCVGEMNALLRWIVIPAMQAVGKAPYVNALTAADLRAAFERHGFVIIAEERHGTGGKDTSPFIIAQAG